MLAALASTAALRAHRAPGLCLGVLDGWAIVRTTTSRQFAGTRTLRECEPTMRYRKNPTPEQKAAAQAKRADLIARTRPLQSARKAGLLPWAELPTINACLELIYTSETGQTEWKTFLGWKEAGYGVIKGEKGFPIWGRPVERKDGVTEERAFEFFPVSNLFHAGQVVDADGRHPAKASALNPFLIAVRTLPLALPAPSESTREAV